MMFSLNMKSVIIIMVHFMMLTVGWSNPDDVQREITLVLRIQKQRKPLTVNKACYPAILPQLLPPDPAPLANFNLRHNIKLCCNVAAKRWNCGQQTENNRSISATIIAIGRLFKCDFSQYRDNSTNNDNNTRPCPGHCCCCCCCCLTWFQAKDYASPESI